MRLGAHVPTRGRLPDAVPAALRCRADAFQVFVSNPRAWAPPAVSPDTAREFAARRAAAGLGPVLVHASYLVNLASPDEGLRRRSLDLARREMEAARGIGADGLVVHAGAGGAAARAAALDRAAASATGLAAEGPVLLELTAGGAGAVASTLAEARELLQACGGHPGIGIVLDTAHLFAAGAPLDSPEGVRATLDELRRLGLAPRLRAVHANDAAHPRGSRRDRHEHIGEGHIGEAGFRALLADPLVAAVPIIVETPGGLEDHARNIGRLRDLAAA